MIYQERKYSAHFSGRDGLRNANAARLPPEGRSVIQCLFVKAEEVEKLQGVEESRRRALADCLRLLEMNEKEIEHARLFAKKYSGANRLKLLLQRAELLAEAERLLLCMPFSRLSERSKESELISDWFDQVYSEREQIMGWCAENGERPKRTEFLNSCFYPVDITAGLKNAWELLHRWFPEDIEAFEALPGDIGKDYRSFRPGRLSMFGKDDPRPDGKKRDPRRTAVFNLTEKSSGTVCSVPETDLWQILPNYLIMYWDVLMILQEAGKLPQPSLVSDLSSLRECLLRLPHLHVLPNPYYVDWKRKQQNYISEEPANQRVKEWWLDALPVPHALGESQLHDSGKFVRKHRAGEEDVQIAVKDLERPYLLEALEDKLWFAWDEKQHTFTMHLSEGISDSDLAQLFFMQHFFSLSSGHSRVFPWKHLPAESSFIADIRREIIEKEAESEENMRKDLHLDERIISGWELQQAWNSKVKMKTNRESLTEHSFYAFNEWKNHTQESPFSNGPGLLLGNFNNKSVLYDFEGVTDEAVLSQDPYYWEAVGEAVMQSILLGNWSVLPPAVNGKLPYFSKENGPTLFSPLQVRHVLGKSRCQLYHQWPRMSLEGYCAFLEAEFDKVDEEHPSEDLVLTLKRRLKEHLLDLLNVFMETGFFVPSERLRLECRWLFHFDKLSCLMNGMHRVLLNIYRNYDECELLARKAIRFFPSAPYSIFMELLSAIPQIIDEIGFDNSVDALERRIKTFSGYKHGLSSESSYWKAIQRRLLSAHKLNRTSLDIVRVREKGGMEELYPANAASFVRVQHHGRIDLLVFGELAVEDLGKFMDLEKKQRIYRLVLLRFSPGVDPPLPDIFRIFCEKKRINIFKEDSNGLLISET
ncbi:MAG: hypothetical protein MI784_00930 [Cytophagales bacterium]|nr:hypothetical protein [Cytophagales bacterium]